jgi:hypothetical protein
MKPTKNNYFCIKANKTKLRFNTQKKAERFIEFNQFEILKQNNKMQIRTYYCDSCQAFHVTSKKEFISLADKSLDELNLILSNSWKRLDLILKTNNFKLKKVYLIELGNNILKLNELFQSSYHKKSLIRFNTLKSVLIYNEFFLDLFINDKSTKISSKANNKILILKDNKTFNHINTLNTWERVLNPI